MPQVGQITSCTTADVRGLSQQIIAEMNQLVAGGALVRFDERNVTLTGAAVTPYLQPAAKEALQTALQSHPDRKLAVNSAFRTVAQQFLLFSWFKAGTCGISLAAAPGKSNHEDGLALDIADHGFWKSALESHGWVWLGPKDPVHFTFEGGGTRSDISVIGIRAFQRLWNRHHPEDRIGEDGAFGSQTAARLKASPAEGFPGPRILHRVDPPLQGDDVRRVQEALVLAGIPHVPHNSIFDGATEAAVKAFQLREELAADGIVGPATRRELGILLG